MKNSLPTIIIIIGISGDLSRRKLLPALAQIAAAGELPTQCKIVGVTRKTDLAFSDLLVNVKKPESISDRIELWNMDLTSQADYEKLREHLQEIEQEFSRPAQRLFYLSVPPQISLPIIEFLGISKLASVPHTKLLLEKPFGIDLESAQEMIERINLYFNPDQIYRIDHYLAKETTQNIVVFRNDNSLFKRTWNKDFIERIEIVVSETIGIEGRVAFYEQTGALRDVVQSHLLQLAALTLMDVPDDKEFSEIPKLRLSALKNLHLPFGRTVAQSVKRGQYDRYRTEVNNQKSTVETFVSLTLESDDPKWTGVPIQLTAGKSLDKKFTGIKIFYKKDKNHEANQLILRLQPNESIELCLFAKRPGYEYQVEKHSLRFTFQEYYSNLPEAYEQVLFDAINSNHTLFTTSAEILESWRILDSIQRAWKIDSTDLVIYKSGSAPEKILKLTEQKNE